MSSFIGIYLKSASSRTAGIKACTVSILINPSSATGTESMPIKESKSALIIDEIITKITAGIMSGKSKNARFLSNVKRLSGDSASPFYSSRSYFSLSEARNPINIGAANAR